MKFFTRLIVCGLVALLAPTGCAKKKPPLPPEPVVEPEPEPEPPPPPPPKCEALKEECKAKESTEVSIPGTDYLFTPPSGWTYAKLEEATVAQVGEHGSVLVLTTFEPPEQKFKVPAKRTELLTSLTELVGVKPNGTIRLYQPNTSQEMGDLKMSLWERSDAKRGEASGALLIVSSPSDQRELFGFGFAPKEDEDGTKAILESLQSLKRGEKAASNSEEGADSKGEDRSKKEDDSK
ncbi:MAG: hypothetical protein ABIH03_09005 [Pseudomonadota bacterium]